jgi:hypothetical protein
LDCRIFVSLSTVSSTEWAISTSTLRRSWRKASRAAVTEKVACEAQPIDRRNCYHAEERRDLEQPKAAIVRLGQRRDAAGEDATKHKGFFVQRQTFAFPAPTEMLQPPLLSSRLANFKRSPTLRTCSRTWDSRVGTEAGDDSFRAQSPP